MPTTGEAEVSTVGAMYVFVGVDHEPFAAIVHMFAVVGVYVRLREIVPSSVVVIVSATRSVDMVAGCVVPEPVVVEMPASGVVVVLTA